jgi:hypothetical protein
MVCSACKNIFLGDLPPLYDEVVKSNDVFKDRASEQRCIRPFHEDISELCQGALNGCQICDIIWRHFFRDKTPQEYTVNPAFLRNGEIHRFFGSGTHYRIRRPDKRFRGDYTLNALELEVGLNSPMDRDIPQYKSIMLAPVEGIRSIIYTALLLKDYRRAIRFHEKLAVSRCEYLWRKYVGDNSKVVVRL